MKASMTALIAALNKANNRARLIMARGGIETATDLFTLTENPEVRRKLARAEKAVMDTKNNGIIYRGRNKGTA